MEGNYRGEEKANQVLALPPDLVLVVGLLRVLQHWDKRTEFIRTQQLAR
jgi:hypothetical protein